MKAIFKPEREKQNYLCYKEYENDSYIPGFHSHLELYFIDDGEMDITVNTHYKRLRAGEMCVVLSFDSHAYSTPKTSKSAMLMIPVYLCGEFIEATRHKKAVNPFITDKTVVSRIRMLSKVLGQTEDNDILKKGYIYTILGIVYENLSFEEITTDEDPNLISQLLLYIHEHFAEDITLKKIAMEFGYNENYLSRYFSSTVGIGFSRYLTTVRLKNTLIMMYSGKSLTLSAFDSGFNSLRTFYRCFKHEFSMTPKQYLDANKNT